MYVTKLFFKKKNNRKSKLGISLITDRLRREWGDSGWREFSEKLEALCVVFGVVLQGVVHPSKFIKLFTSTVHTLLYITMPQWYWLKSDVLLSDELGGNMWKKNQETLVFQCQPCGSIWALHSRHNVAERSGLMQWQTLNSEINFFLNLKNFQYSTGLILCFSLLNSCLVDILFLHSAIFYWVSMTLQKLC